MFIFLDETGADRRNALRRHGYSLCGKPLKNNTMLVRGENVSGLAFMSVNGLLDVSVVKGTTDGDTFYDFVQKHLLPQLLPFDGVNPHSVVVMDNCSVHHIQQTVSMIGVGAIVHFLPPYSPDLNPIEECFAKVKSEIKCLERTMDISDIEIIILAAFASITPEDCHGWVSHSKMYGL